MKFQQVIDYIYFGIYGEELPASFFLQGIIITKKLKKGKSTGDLKSCNEEKF